MTLPPMPEPVPPANRDSGPLSPPRRMAGAALLLSLATLLSRVLGLVREQVFAALLGAGFYGDAFTTAFRLPNLLRDLFAEGALSAAFQPAFQAARKHEGLVVAQRLANLVGTCLLIVVSALVILGVIFAPEMVQQWATGFSLVAGKAELTVQLTRIMMPFLLLVSLAALAMGMLNAEGRFTPPALAPALFNLATVLTGLGLWLFGAGQSRGAAMGWAVATLCGGALQLGLQLVPLYRSGYRFRLAFDWRDSRLRGVIKTMAPATIGLMATQVNIYISSKFASTEQGATACLYYAFRVMQLPIGMFGVAVGTVALQRAAESAHAVDLQVAIEGVRETLRRGLRLVTFYSLPTAVAFYVLAEPMVSAIYQHGAFQAADTQATAVALRYYALGLIFYSAVKVVVPVFYAQNSARLAVLASIAAVFASLLMNITLHPHYGYRVLALSTSVGAAVNLLVLLLVFLRRHGGLLQPAQILALLRMAVAAVVMGLVLWMLAPLLLGPAVHATGWLPGPGGVPLWRAISGLGLLVGLGGLVYTGLCGLLQVGELDDLLSALRRRVQRR
jgi:putative peptidoglycan lipid II flippase